MTYMRSLALKLVAAAADDDDDVEMTQMLSIVTCEYWQLRHRVHSLKPYIYQQHRLHGVALLTDSQTLHLISLTLCLVLYSRLHTHTQHSIQHLPHEDQEDNNFWSNPDLCTGPRYGLLCITGLAVHHWLLTAFSRQTDTVTHKTRSQFLHQSKL